MKEGEMDQNREQGNDFILSAVGIDILFGKLLKPSLSVVIEGDGVGITVYLCY